MIPAWMGNYIHHEVWDEITYPFPNFNEGTAEFWEWKSNFIPHLLSGEPDYFGRNKISSGGDLSHYSSASLY